MYVLLLLLHLTKANSGTVVLEVPMHVLQTTTITTSDVCFATPTTTTSDICSATDTDTDTSDACHSSAITSRISNVMHTHASVLV